MVPGRTGPSDVVASETVTYEVPGLEAGNYFFRCDAHPGMAGTFVAAPMGH